MANGVKINSAKLYMETIHDEYIGDDPVFFDTDAFEWCAMLQQNADKIIEELAPVFQPGFDGFVSNYEAKFQFPPKIWKAFPFYFNGFKIKKHTTQFPFTASLLAQVPNLLSAFVSELKPGSRLLPHNGNSNGIMRYHLGLVVPASFPECGFIIGGNEISWAKGEHFMFCNMQVHSAQNLTNKSRFILLLDVVRPEFVKQKRRIAAHTLAALLTNVTADSARKLLGVQKSELATVPSITDINKFEPNKPYVRKEKFNPKGLKQYFFHYAERITLHFYILIFTIILSFKRFQ